MYSFFEILRPFNCLMASLAVFLGAIISFGSFYPLYFIPTYLGALVVFVICGSGNVLNDYYDLEIDKINAPKRPIPSGRMSPKTAFNYSLVLFLGGIIISYFINMESLIIAIIASVLLTVYAKYGKKMGFLGNIIVASLVGFTLIYGALSIYPQGVLSKTIILALCAVLANIAREIIKDIEDLEGDKKSGTLSLPSVYGVKTSKNISCFFLMLAIVLSFVPPYLGIFKSTIYIGTIIVADLIFASVIIHLNYTTVTKTIASQSQKWLKLGMSMALIAFLMGNW